MTLINSLLKYFYTKIDSIAVYDYLNSDGLNEQEEKAIFQPQRLCFATHISKSLAFIIDIAILSTILVWFHIHGLAWFFCALLYFCILESSALQGSIGERLLGIKVFHNRGKKLHWKHIFIRNLTYFSTAGLSSLSSLLSRKHSSLHDQLAHTIVFKEKKAR
jgi:uncharacterized RDD family membrane protein YckC